MNNVYPIVKNFLWSAFTENLGLKAIAAIIAFALYFLVMFQEESERIFDVQVIWHLPQESTGLTLSSKLPDSLKVRLRGPRSSIESAKPSDIRVKELNLSKNEEGAFNFYFTQDDFEIPTRTKFLRVSPEQVLVKLERLNRRNIPVRVRTYGKLKSGMELFGNPTATPNALSVEGPASVMRYLSSIDTEEIDLESLDAGDHKFTVPVKRIEGVSITRGDAINVTLKVRWISDKRIFQGLHVETRGTKLTAEIKPIEVSVVMTGPQAALNKVDSAKIIPVAVIPEERKNRTGSFTQEITVEGLPENASVISITPNKVQVRLTNSVFEQKKEANKK